MTACPHFPFADRPGMALDSEYLQCFREQPLVPVQLSNGRQALLVTRHADVKRVLSDPRFSREAWAGGTLMARDSKSLALATSDAPVHTRRRRAVQAAFAPRQAEMDRSRIEALTEELLDAVEAAGSPVDLIATFTLPLPYSFTCEMLGIPKSDIPLLHPWVDVMMSAGLFSREEIAEAQRKMFGYFNEHLRIKRELLAAGAPADDLLTKLLAMSGEDRLTDEELVVMGFGLMIAGGETTMNHLALAIYHLLRHPELAARLRQDPARIPSTVEELLRWVWFNATGGQPHVALEAVDLPGGRIEAGQVVIPLMDSANRDPAVFGHDAFDPDRAPNPHLGFGHGRHMCLGASHARAELQIALAALLRRFPNLELAVPEEKLEWRSGMFIRGLWKLPVRWSK
ncbi:cytochrome P450 [Pendulispora brunnea]|uniref:Cytochrome P450 n=1 Tax=Pendulispora brunnea TaxID=2905690 RepID=A0ABZ2KHL1_9BACT